ncbi:MAG: HAMP domain-containing sensor histidine kinase [Pseudomonadota bacterium]
MNLIDKYRKSLSTKLFVLVVACVLIAETVVMIPSIAYHRLSYLQNRIEAAHIICLAYQNPTGSVIEDTLAQELFDTAGVVAVSATYEGQPKLIFSPNIRIDPAEGAPVEFTHEVDLTEGWTLAAFTAPWASLFSTGDNLISVKGMANFAQEESVKVLISQKALRADLLVYFRNILLLSLVISSLTAIFVYFRLARMIVEPVKALSSNMKAFEGDPEDPRNLLVPNERIDELGIANTSLAALEGRTQALLSERRRLAALGSGISKISHDLRNILSSAQLISDRLVKSEDPRVAKLAPRLLAALDRAVALSRDTLNFARMSPDRIKRKPVALKELVDDVFDDAARMAVTFENNVSADIIVEADQTHLFRALFNLVKNAAEAIEGHAPVTDDTLEGAPPKVVGTVEAAATLAGNDVIISISDTGPGLPDVASENLFEPFKGSQKPGGSGLGIAIAAEVAKAHGGRLNLEKSDATGATFVLTLPVSDTALLGSAENRGSTAQAAE